MLLTNALPSTIKPYSTQAIFEDFLDLDLN